MVRTIIDKIKSLFEEDKIEVKPKKIKSDSKSNNQNYKY